jgi:predicted kinase
MKNPKIIILRGKPTSGKSTAFKSLRKEKNLSNWAFPDFAFIKDKMYDNLKDKERYELAKKSISAILKELMNSKKNIIIEEVSRNFLKNRVGYHIKKNNYKIIVFQFEVSKEEGYKRDIQREKDGWHPTMGKEWVDKTHKHHEKIADKNGIIVDTNKLSKKQTTKFILKNLK